MVRKIKKYLEEICSLKSGDAIVAGVSGGADSVCLLCVLREIYAGTGVTIHAVHVNHNLRAEADADQKYVERLCGKWNIPCYCYSYDVEGYAADHRISTEEAGRQLRYGAFYEVQDRLTASGCIKIAVAHTMDDNAETMLLNLFRGTGLKGLRGIPVSRGDIIRPLLCVRRSEIESWLETQGIEWCNDCSNDTDDYTRNKIRHKILPVAETEINENAVLHMNRTAKQLALAEDYLTDKAAEAWDACVRPLMQKPDGLIIGDSVLALHPYLRKCVLLRAMQETAETARDISAVHVEALEGLFDLQCGKELHLAYGMRAERTYDGVMIRKKPDDMECSQKYRQDASEDAGIESIDLKISGSTEIPGYGIFETRVLHSGKRNFCEFPKDRYTKWFDYDKIKNTVCLRTRQAEDYLVIDGNDNTQKLKSYLINQKIPSGEREKLLLIADGKHIMWVVGYRCSYGYYISESTENILEVRYRSGFDRTPVS
ncbi:MAG: tRNA lysidine(34) synthetase TilS [Lachnospiraceae bacterium]|nr:tRNA lysidine(34) synthetase TilS [Lachnospiraceae bacterium]